MEFTTRTDANLNPRQFDVPICRYHEYHAGTEGRPIFDHLDRQSTVPFEDVGEVTGAVGLQMLGEYDRCGEGGWNGRNQAGKCTDATCG
jgi:hypothetical protein